MAQTRKSTNLGATSLRRKRSKSDPMREFDALPTPLRQWLAEACLPWSPASARKIWMRARKEGESVAATLERLKRAEAKTLARDRVSVDA
ncbi:MAG: hypothetical protein HRU30_00965 [Rhodobacteraceae bacterium]|nr:hypothetical protein [Paracoccaceae bacterium]